MIMSLVAIGIVGIVAYIWVLRGFFSAFIHMICTVAAGAIAFASFEVVAHKILESAPTTGFGAVFGDMAYGLALASTFIVSLALLRLLMDGILRANMKLTNVGDYIGGGICGAVAGTITAGIAIMTLGFARLDADLLGYQPLRANGQGNVTREGGLLFPVDKITTRLYGSLSRNSFYHSDESFGRFYPNLHEMPGAIRIAAMGTGRNTVSPRDVKLNRWFTIGQGSNLPTNVLLSDAWNSGPQRITDLDGEQPQTGSYIVGFSLNFGSGSKERGGDNKIVVTSSQIWIVAENSAGESRVIYPIAVTGQAEAAQPTKARFRFDAQDTPMASTGGASSADFDFEFVVPPDFRPMAVFAKGARIPVMNTDTNEYITKPTSLPNPAARDASLGASGVIDSGPVDTGGAIDLMAGVTPVGNAPVQIPGVRATNSVGQTLNKTNFRTMDTNENNHISEGQQTFTQEDLQNTPTEKSLRVEQFAVSSDTGIVQIDVGPNSKMSLLGQVAKSAEEVAPLLLVDSNGVLYEPIGFIHYDNVKKQQTIRFTPNEPVRAMKAVPGLSRSRPDDKLTLLFRVSLGVTIKDFRIGNKVVATFDLKVDQPQGRR
jgi:hypothetical protein